MDNIAERMYAQARINPIKEPNHVHTVTKMGNGDLRVRLNSGRMFKIDKDDEIVQAFIVYTAVAGV